MAGLTSGGHRPGEDSDRAVVPRQPRLKRHGRSWQQPARRAIERDDGAVVLWKREVWPQAKARRRPVAPGSSARTRPASRWGRHARGPGAASARLRSCASGAGVPAGFGWREWSASVPETTPARLIYSFRVHRDRKGGPNGFTVDPV
ncbi:winged helix-turn-helix domain-containing protein [Streptomyces atratus]|uniref:winged helix-turn-helix domain-containing protein n=1 Tax=Streptomyces atratus TaxID=1893 RepID=UPI0021A8762B|nr:winged helix-turn-helix domain-containing protein [Streptomyces atratus]MCT2544127.1 winged helix-turn-helix domain-containing protein [Streptomyces atratus]